MLKGKAKPTTAGDGLGDKDLFDLLYDQYKVEFQRSDKVLNSGINMLFLCAGLSILITYSWRLDHEPSLELWLSRIPSAIASIYLLRAISKLRKVVAAWNKNYMTKANELRKYLHDHTDGVRLDLMLTLVAETTDRNQRETDVRVVLKSEAREYLFVTSVILLLILPLRILLNS